MQHIQSFSWHMCVASLGHHICIHDTNNELASPCLKPSTFPTDIDDPTSHSSLTNATASHSLLTTLLHNTSD